MTNGVYVYNPIFTFLSLLAFLLSVGFYHRLKHYCSQSVLLSLILAMLFSLIISIIPAFAVALTVSFVPSFIYHSLNPLIIAPFITSIICFFVSWCFLTLIREFVCIIDRKLPPPHLMGTLTAVLIFFVMLFALRHGLMDYSVIFHARQINHYAAMGTDQTRLKEIFTEVAASRDNRMFEDIAPLLAANRNVSPDLLNDIFIKTAASNINAMTRDHIYLSLMKNPNTSVGLLQNLMFALSQTKTLPANSGMLTNLSSKHAFSRDTLLKLAAYPDCEVRRAILSYPDIPPEVLNQIEKNDPDISVRHDARQRLDFLQGVTQLENTAHYSSKTNARYMASKIGEMDNSNQLHHVFDTAENMDGASLVLQSLAANCFISGDLARKIYKKADTMKSYARTVILVALAGNPQTPGDILNKLVVEKDLAILHVLASNPNLPSVATMKLLPFPDCRIRKEIICISNTPRVLLRKLQNDRDESVKQEANKRLLQGNEYLNNCTQVKKLNPSCQKYYSTIVPDIRLYPNTSQRQSLMPKTQKEQNL